MHVVYPQQDKPCFGCQRFVLPVERYEELTDALRDQFAQLEDLGGHKLAAHGFNVALRAIEVNTKDITVEGHPCKQVALATELVEAIEDFTNTWEEPWVWAY